MEIRYFIREKRKERGLTQADLAENIGMAWMTIHRIESGKTEPGYETVSKILSVLGYRLDITPLAEAIQSPAEGR